jgi:hypothetical protein
MSALDIVVVQIDGMASRAGGMTPHQFWNAQGKAIAPVRQTPC